MNIEEGLVIAGKFRLERPLARGGMGSVWVAHHLQLDTEVAVKFMDPELTSSSSARVRFEREARASALVKSPHVVQVLDYGLQDDTPYIAMELLDGESLSTRLRRRKRLPVADVVRILEPICRGLRRAHEAGIVHRDLKPGNVFIVRHDEDEIVKILDFGIAKSLLPQDTGDTTRTGALVGSPFYMSPEQVRRSKEVDARTDLWAVGVIAYQALTGALPFSGEIGAVLVAICTEPFRPASQLVPELGPAVDRFFERALARDPAQRFQTARELGEAFAVVAGEPSLNAFSGTFSAPPSVAPLSGRTPVASTPSPAPAGEGSLSPAGRSHAGSSSGARRGVIAGVVAAAVAVGATTAVWAVHAWGAGAAPAAAASPSIATEARPDPGPAPTASATLPAPTVAPAPPAASSVGPPAAPSAAPPAKLPSAPVKKAPPPSDVQKRIGL